MHIGNNTNVYGLLSAKLIPVLRAKFSRLPLMALAVSFTSFSNYSYKTTQVIEL